jgi:hypothetical protein
LDHYEKVPRLVRGIQKYTPFFKSGKDSPIIEAEFEHGLREIKMGCGYLIAQDKHFNLFGWGDNYAG